MKTITIIGGGARQKSLAAELGKRYNVMHFEKTAPSEALALSEAVILPLPATSDGIHVNFSDMKITDLFGHGDKTYIGGRITDTFDIYRKKYAIIDYTLVEEFAIRNAVPTAEAALQLAIENTPFTIHSSKCLITGYGRISKVLAKMLWGMGANVTCCARKASVRAQIDADGYRSISFGELGDCESDIIFNTVPSPVLTEEIISKSDARLIIDLASGVSGGTDFKAAEKYGIKALHALALPGKTAPETAAKITADTILALL